MADQKSDPRPDRQDRPHPHPTPDKSTTFPADGGLGTDTPRDPAHAPDAQPSKK